MAQEETTPSGPAGPAPAAAPAKKKWGMKTHLALFSILVAVFSVSSGFSAWIWFSATYRWDAHLERSLRLLATLPDVRDGIRKVDLATDLYLNSGNPIWLRERSQAIDELRNSYNVLAKVTANSRRANRLIADSRRDYQGMLKEQQQSIDLLRLQARRDMSSEAKTRQLSEDLVADAQSLSDIYVKDVERGESGLETRRLETSLFRLFIEFAASAGVAFYLFFYILRPFSVFRRAAESWRLGESWPAPPVGSAMELRRHFDFFGDMAGRLNIQYSKVQELNDIKTRLMSLVTHEFGNALAIIGNAASLIEEKIPSKMKEEQGALVQMIMSNVRLLGNATHNILNMSRIEGGRFIVNDAACDIEELLRDSAERLSVLAERKNIQLAIVPPKNPLRIKADPVLLSLALSNLITNAIRYSNAGGHVEVAASEFPQSRSCMIYVQDDGIGISPEDQKKIFSYYFRTQEGKRMESRGFGIGLAVTRQIIEAMGGELKIQSTLGKGSNFSFFLPIWTDAPPPGGAGAQA